MGWTEQRREQAKLALPTYFDSFAPRAVVLPLPPSHGQEVLQEVKDETKHEEMHEVRLSSSPLLTAL